MKFIKIFSAFVFLSAIVFYLNGCSSAEQTTAKLAYNQGDYKKAEIEFEKETKQNPQNEEAWFYLTMSRAKLGKLEGVKTAMEQYTKIGKNSFRSELVDMWGSVYDEGYKNYTQGEAFLKSNDEKSALNKFNESIKYFEIAYALLPDSAEVKKNIDGINGKINTIVVKPLIDKGVELEKQGNYEGAIGQYKQALDKVSKGTPAYEVVTYNMALANIKWAESLNATNPEDPNIKSKYSDALPLLQELANSSNKQNQLDAYKMLVVTYGNLGMTKEAQDAIKMRDQLEQELKK